MAKKKSPKKAAKRSKKGIIRPSPSDVIRHGAAEYPLTRLTGFAVIHGKLPTDSDTDPEDRVRMIDGGTNKVLWDGDEAAYQAVKQAVNSEGG